METSYKLDLARRTIAHSPLRLLTPFALRDSRLVPDKTCQNVTVKSGRVGSQPPGPAADTNRHSYKTKKRYEKLIRSLLDGEKQLQDNLKSAQLFQPKSSTDEKLSHANQEIRDKLKIRDKKKYESLIIYQKDQFRAYQKTFQEMLPERLEQIEATAEKQSSKPVHLVPKKPRRRRSETLNSREQTQMKRAYPDMGKRKSCLASKLHHKSLSITNQQRRPFSKRVSIKGKDKDNLCQRNSFRIEIVDKTGAEQVIELNGKEFKAALQSSNCTGSVNANLSKVIDSLSKQSKSPVQASTTKNSEM
ncbi:hypothetical protein PoB_000513100 [Plakobranchus ocellatus]|uniref:Uncharacterized protein n=1 Tax=Plakobranchus ocellatus TaxID=259542 RepID=A0AAV3Y885_9GAST|nr:hypothetical protein PoB_000513100 [Plakobranchus ocellatus]